MGYNVEQHNVINKWLSSVGCPWLKSEDIGEYRPGQLLTAAEYGLDCIRTYDEWQRLQELLKVELPLDVSRSIVGCLFGVANIDIMDIGYSECKYMNTTEMWIKAQNDGKFYECIDTDIAYSKSTGLVDKSDLATTLGFPDLEYYNVRTLDQLMDYKWKKLSVMSIEEAEAKLGVRIIRR